MSPARVDAFILAAGLGFRARPLSLVRPKPLFPLGDVPLIRLLVRQLPAENVNAVFVNLHYRGGDIRFCLQDETRVRFLEERQLSGSRILADPRAVSAKPLLAVNGDVFMRIPLDEIWREFHRFPCDGVLLVRRRTVAAYKAVDGESGWYRGTRAAFRAGDRMYCGVGLFSRRFLSQVREDSFFDSLDRSGLRVRLLDYSGIWLDLGTPGLYHQAQFDYLEYAGLPESAAWSRRSRVHRTSRLKRCIIWDDAEISAGTRLDHVIVADGVRLDGCAQQRRVITRDTNVPL